MSRSNSRNDRFSGLASFLTIAVSLPLSLLLPIGVAGAQVFAIPAPPGAPGTPPSNDDRITGGKLPDPQTIQILQMGIKYIVWNEHTRGPLIVVGAESTGPWRPRPEDMEEDPDNPGSRRWYEPPPLSPPEYRNGWHVETMARYFGRKLTRCGSVSVLSPTLMTVLNTRLPTNVNPMEKIHSYERAQMFQASLTEEQWKLIGSEQGLGIQDLDDQQRPLFLGLISDKARLSRTVQRSQYGEGLPLEKVANLDPANRDGKITTEQRMGARLRMNRTVRLWLPDAENGNTYGAWVPDRLENTEYWTLNDSSEWSERREVFGVKLVADVPAKLKPSQLNYQWDKLNAEITLENDKTVGDLFKQIAKITKLEIYPDSRLANLKVSVRQEEDTTVRAGDILKAVALAVTGTFRKVGPAYVLTDDVEGIGTRRARIQEWQSEGNNQRTKVLMDFYKRLRKMRPASYIQFAPGDPLALSDKLNTKLEARRKVDRSRWRPTLIPTSDLSSAHKKLVEMAIRGHEEQAKYNPQQRPVSGDVVNLQLETRLTMVLPGIGPVDLQSGGMGIESLSPPPEKYVTSDGRSADRPFELPTAMSIGGILLFSPQNEEEILPMLNLVRDRGMKQLWIQLPLNLGEGKQLLTTAVALGKERGIDVFAVIRLMQIPRKKTPKDEKTLVNILGESGAEWAARKVRQTPQWEGETDALKDSGDWLDPAAPETLALLQKQVLDISEVPGLAGVVFRNTAVPGYHKPGTSNSPYDWVRYPLGEMGYNVENRLALLRDASIDPIDIASTSVYFEGGNLTLPFFMDQQVNWIQLPSGEYGPDDKVVTPQRKWYALRYKATQKLMTDLYKAITQAKPKLNLITAFGSDGWNESTFMSWDSVDSIADTTIVPGQGISKSARSAKTLLASVDCSSILKSFRFMEDDAPPQILFNRSLNQTFDWQRDSQRVYNGFVLDFTNMPLKEATPLVLSGIVAPNNNLAQK